MQLWQGAGKSQGMLWGPATNNTVASLPSPAQRELRKRRLCERPPGSRCACR